MNNLSASVKKFLGNKNTVTILGVLLCIVILIIGYNRTINNKVKLTEVPYALETIQPKTQITDAMVGQMMVPEAFIKVGSYYKTRDQIVGKYANYNTMIAAGSLFYTDLLTEERFLPDSYTYDVPSGYTVVNLKVNMDITYGNSMMPESYINMYLKALLPADEQTDEEAGEEKKDMIMFGRFLSNIQILAVKDAQGRHVFDNTEEDRTPAYMLFAIPEEQFLLLKKADYLQNKYAVELMLVPNTEELPDDVKVNVSSEQIKEFIETRTKAVDVTNVDIGDILLPENDDEENNNNNNQE